MRERSIDTVTNLANEFIKSEIGEGGLFARSLTSKRGEICLFRSPPKKHKRVGNYSFEGENLEIHSEWGNLGNESILRKIGGYIEGRIKNAETRWDIEDVIFYQAPPSLT